MEASAFSSTPAQGPGPPGEVCWGGRDQPHPQGSDRPSPGVGERGSGAERGLLGPYLPSRVVEGRGWRVGLHRVAVRRFQGAWAWGRPFTCSQALCGEGWEPVA